MTQRIKERAHQSLMRPFYLIAIKANQIQFTSIFKPTLQYPNQKDTMAEAYGLIFQSNSPLRVSKSNSIQAMPEGGNIGGVMPVANSAVKYPTKGK